MQQLPSLDVCTPSGGVNELLSLILQPTPPNLPNGTRGKKLPFLPPVRKCVSFLLLRSFFLPVFLARGRKRNHDCSVFRCFSLPFPPSHTTITIRRRRNVFFFARRPHSYEFLTTAEGRRQERNSTQVCDSWILPPSRA